MKKILGWIPALVFLLGMAFLTIPDIYRRRAINVLLRADASTRRRTETGWQLFWARFYYGLILPLAGVKMPIKIQGEIDIGGACILIANHCTALDGFVLAAVAHRLGIDDVLWIVKEGMRSAPVVGGSLERAGHAFVRRRADPEDKNRVQAMTVLARMEGASVALFPEGTRFTGSEEERGNYRFLRDPKRGGLQAYMDAFPDYPIVFVCMDWRGLRGGKTIWDGDSLLGIHGAVTVWHMLRQSEDTAQSILERGWTLMDEILRKGETVPFPHSRLRRQV
jgi:1-acyl-sn-glycerol-3-phosphate acyltransferase